MKKCLAALLTVLALPGCKTAAPKGGPQAPASPDVVSGYVGQLRILRHQGDERALTLDASRTLTGECDLAVRVRTATFEKGSARFGLETIGLPRAGGGAARCQRLLPGSLLTLTDLGASPDAGTVATRIDAVLQTPEAFLAAKGVSFDLASGPPPVEIASREPDANESERALARKVITWPKPLLSVDTLDHDVSGRVRYEGLVEFVAVVGTDGRLYQPSLKGSLSDTHQAAVFSALTLWRFEPARQGDAPVAARVPLRTTLKIY